MEGNHSEFLITPFFAHLDTISGIKFSSREMDILACILAGRTAKKIASFLSLSPKTIENYIRNITLKLECNSREGIIDFIEQSDKIFIIKNHYSSLLIQVEFEKILKDIAKQSHNKPLNCLLVYGAEEVSARSFIQLFLKHLKLAGLTVITKAQQELKNLSQNTIELLNVDYIICVGSQQNLESLQDKKELIASCFQDKTEALKKILYLLFENGNFLDVSKLTEYTNIGAKKEKNYYLFFLELLKKLLPQLNTEKMMLEFKAKHEAMNSSPRRAYSQLSSSEQKSEKKKSPVRDIINLFIESLLKKRIRYGLSAFLIMGLLGIGFLKIREAQEEKEPKEENYIQTHNQIKQATDSARSDLVLPTEDVLLDRPDLIAAIDEKLTSENGIQTIALVGGGGVGKTTLARRYAHQQKANIIWEINAETLETLKYSFENLVCGLAATEEEQKLLRTLQDIKNPQEKQKQIIQFAKEKLKASLHWFLIYDNVEKAADIQQYFPLDSRTWGQGKIIITTRNTNIQNSNLVNNVIFVGELNQNQKLELFTKIMNHISISPKENAEDLAFLENIPPFPLDISVAAYYLKSTNISYEEYIKNLENYNIEFENLHKSILNEKGEYTKTRYAIITQSLEHLMKTHKDFGELLLFISMLDSQDIPRELLEKYKGGPIVDNFIYNLKKHSLITNNFSDTTSSSIFSIHRSTQAIIFAYLNKFLNLNEDNLLLKKIVCALDDYIDQILEQEDFSQMHVMASHLEKFLSYHDLLTDFSKGLLKSKLGNIYYFNINDKSHRIATESLNFLKTKILEQLSSADTSRFARALLHIGAIYTELRLYKEAQEVFEKAINIYKQEGIKNYVDLSWAFSHLGNVYRRLGNYEKARFYLEESINLHKQYGVNKKRLARTLAYLGSVYRGLGFYQKSIDTLEESLTIYNKNYSSDHFRIGWTLTRLGNVYSDLGDFEKAKQYFENGISFSKKYFPEDHVSMGLTLTYLGNCYRELREYEKSRNSLEQSLKIHQKHFDENYRRMGWVLFHLATTYKALGKHQDAQKLYDKVLEIYANYCNDDGIETAGILRNMAKISLEKGRFDDAEDLIKRSLKILQSRQHVDAYRSLEVLGEVYLKKFAQSTGIKNNQESQNLKDQAWGLLNQAVKIAEQNFPKNSVHIERIKSRMKSMQE